MSMTKEQVQKALELIGGVENIYQILINNERRFTINTEEDYDTIQFDHENELFIVDEVYAGAMKVKTIFPYSVLETIIGFTEDYIDPMVIDNKWREVLRSKTRVRDINGVIAQAEKERQEAMDYNKCPADKE